MGVKIFSCLLLLFFLVSCQPSGPSAETVPTIEEFVVSASTIDSGQAVTFSWRVTSTDQAAVRCQLDVEGDGVFDYSFANCKTTTSQAHTYTSSGDYQPTLIADNARGRAEGVTSLKALGAINFDIDPPKAQGVTETPMNIGVSVESRLEVATVEASVGDRVTSLQFTSASPNCNGDKCLLGFAGTLNLEGLPRGPQILKVTVKDITGNEAVGYRRFVYDRSPTLTVEAPGDYSVALPSLAVKTQCLDDDAVNCSIRVFIEGTFQVLATGKGTIETTLDLSQFDGQTLPMVFEGTDSAGRVVVQRRTVYVNVDNSKLKLVNAVPGRILQVNERGILYSLKEIESIPAGTPSAYSLELGYLNRQTGTSYSQKPLKGTTFPVKDDPAYGSSFLTNKGAILTSSDLDRGYFTYEWIDGKLEFLAEGKARAANGNYMVWERDVFTDFLGSEAKLRNLSSGEEQIIDLNEGSSSDFDLAKNGAMAVSFLYRISSNRYYTSYFWKEGTATRLSEGSYSVKEPLTDGTSVVFQIDRIGPGVYLYSPAGEVLLSEGYGTYRITNGWVAFTRPNSQGQLQVWLRNPAGEEKQLTFFGASSTIEALSSNGEVVLTNGGKRYWINNSGDLREIPIVGEPIWVEGWYIVLGNSLFQVTP
jgi:hypothetical protein